jgi:hypothetical protein
MRCVLASRDAVRLMNVFDALAAEGGKRLFSYICGTSGIAALWKSTEFTAGL